MADFRTEYKQSNERGSFYEKDAKAKSCNPPVGIGVS